MPTRTDSPLTGVPLADPVITMDFAPFPAFTMFPINIYSVVVNNWAAAGGAAGRGNGKETGGRRRIEWVKASRLYKNWDRRGGAG